MFSKPIIFAGASIASTKAAVLAQTSTAMVDGTDKSDAIGCGKCLGFTNGIWINQGADSKWSTVASTPGISVATSTLTGGICCIDGVTDQTDGSSSFCSGVINDAVKNTHFKIETNDYFMAALA